METFSFEKFRLNNAIKVLRVELQARTWRQRVELAQAIDALMLYGGTEAIQGYLLSEQNRDCYRVDSPYLGAFDFSRDELAQLACDVLAGIPESVVTG